MSESMFAGMTQAEIQTSYQLMLNYQASEMFGKLLTTVTPLEPTKSYFIVLRYPDDHWPQQLSLQLKMLRDALEAQGIKCVVAALPEAVEVQCIEQEAPQERE